MAKQSIVMYGPTYGHNITPFLDFFNQQANYTLFFIYRGNLNFQKEYSKIQFFRYSLNPRKIFQIKNLLKKDIKLIWFHGGYNPYTLLIFKLLKQRRTILTLNIWNEYIPQLITKKTYKSLLFKYILKRYDYIHCNWYGTENLLVHGGFKNTIVLFWGLDKSYFFRNTKEKTIINQFVLKFIKSLPENKIKFFYPKSITQASRHDILVEALKKLKEDKINNFIVYFWLGNVHDDNAYDKLIKSIECYDLEENIKIIRHPFLDIEEYKIIWNYMDCGLQIAERDQLSSTFTEPLALKKEVIATKIESYLIFEKKFKLNLNLVEIDADKIYRRILNFIEGARSGEKEINLRYNVMKNQYCFQDNIQKALDFYLDSNEHNG